MSAEMFNALILGGHRDRYYGVFVGVKQRPNQFFKRALPLLFFKSPHTEREAQLAYHLKYFIRPMWSKKEGKYNYTDPLF
jgi:hypothetical protein